MIAASSNLSFSLRDYANQLEQIHHAIAALANSAPEYREIVSRVASNVRSVSTVIRAAATVINTMELRKEHLANSQAARAAKAPVSGRERSRDGTHRTRQLRG